MKQVSVIFIDDANEAYKKLNKIINNQLKEGKQNTEEMRLLKSIKQKVDFIKLNPFYGDNISKKLIPKEYSVSNLWRVELSQFWRMLYTIRGDNIEIVCFVLDIFNHKEYNKKFNYRGK